MLSKATVGAWLVTGGFYEPNNPAYRVPVKALVQVGWGLGRVGGWPVAWAGAAGAVVVLLQGLVRKDRQDWWFVLALAGCAALPYYAFVSGHPFRIRYMILLITAAAACIGMLVALLPKAYRPAVLLLVLGVLAFERRPLGLTSPMVAGGAVGPGQPEGTARRDRLPDGAPGVASRSSSAWARSPTTCRRRRRAGWRIRHYIHEGIGEIWYEALKSPRRHAAFVLVEEKAEGGDQLFQMAQKDPAFLDGFTRTCEGGGVALYVRTPR